MTTVNGFELNVDYSELTKIPSSKKMGELYGYKVILSSSPKCVNNVLYIWNNGKKWVVASAIYKGKNFYYYENKGDFGLLETAFFYAKEHLITDGSIMIKGR